MRVHLFCERDGGLHTYAYICVVVQVWQSSLEDGTRMQTHTHTCIQTIYAGNVRHIHACISIRFRIHTQYVCACKCTNAIAPPPPPSLSLSLLVCVSVYAQHIHAYIHTDETSPGTPRPSTPPGTPQNVLRQHATTRVRTRQRDLVKHAQLDAPRSPTATEVYRKIVREEREGGREREREREREKARAREK
jgi:hypothetical protein